MSSGKGDYSLGNRYPKKMTYLFSQKQITFSQTVNFWYPCCFFFWGGGLRLFMQSFWGCWWDCSSITIWVEKLHGLTVRKLTDYMSQTCWLKESYRIHGWFIYLHFNVNLDGKYTEIYIWEWKEVLILVAYGLLIFRHDQVASCFELYIISIILHFHVLWWLHIWVCMRQYVDLGVMYTPPEVFVFGPPPNIPKKPKHHQTRGDMTGCLGICRPRQYFRLPLSKKQQNHLVGVELTSNHGAISSRNGHIAIANWPSTNPAELELSEKIGQPLNLTDYTYALRISRDLKSQVVWRSQNPDTTNPSIGGSSSILRVSRNTKITFTVFQLLLPMVWKGWLSFREMAWFQGHPNLSLGEKREVFFHAPTELDRVPMTLGYKGAALNVTLLWSFHS